MCKVKDRSGQKTVFTFWAVGSVRRTARVSNSQKVMVNVWKGYCVSTKVIPEKVIVKVRSQKFTRK